MLVGGVNNDVSFHGVSGTIEKDNAPTFVVELFFTLLFYSTLLTNAFFLFLYLSLSLTLSFIPCGHKIVRMYIHRQKRNNTHVCVCASCRC